MANNKGERRGNQEASYREVTRTIKGKDYKYIEGRITIDGKPYSRYGKTRPLARAKIDKLRLEGDAKKERPKASTLHDYFDSWLEDEKKVKVETSTHITYKRYIDLYIKKFFKKDVLLSDVTRMDIERYITELSGKYAPATVKKTYHIFSMALKSAERDDLVKKNYITFVDPPKLERKPPKVVPKEVIKELLTVDTSENPLMTLAKFILFTGLRRGEALGLKWADIDFKEKTISIHRSVVKGDKEIIIKSPKTKAGIRIVPIPADFISVLKNHKKDQAAQKKKTKDFYKERDFVFATSTGDNYHPDSVRNGVEKLLKAIGQATVAPHTLRHSYASFLFDIGEDPKVIQSILGHSSVSTTLDIYVHVQDDRKQTTSTKIDQFLKE